MKYHPVLGVIISCALIIAIMEVWEMICEKIETRKKSHLLDFDSGHTGYILTSKPQEPEDLPVMGSLARTSQLPATLLKGKRRAQHRSSSGRILHSKVVKLDPDGRRVILRRGSLEFVRTLF